MTGSFNAGVLGAVAVLSVLAAPPRASDVCEISSDVIRYYELRAQAIMLMQYEDVVVRAVDGVIRCADDTKVKRQICAVAGKAILLSEGGDRSVYITEMKTDAPGEVHIYDDGTLSCGLQGEVD